MTKKVSLAFRDAYQKANNAPTTDAFSAYAFDGWLVMVDAAKRAMAKAQPGTPQFREAFKDAMLDDQGESSAPTASTTSSPATCMGVDERARVLVKLEQGKWKLMQ